MTTHVFQFLDAREPNRSVPQQRKWKAYQPKCCGVLCSMFEHLSKVPKATMSNIPFRQPLPESIVLNQPCHSEPYVESADVVPKTILQSPSRVHLFVFEDNEAVVRMMVKERSPNLRHAARSHRICSDWFVERINLDLVISIGYVFTIEEMAD